MIDTGRFDGLSARIAELLPAPPETWRRVTGFRADPRWRIALVDGGSVFAKVATEQTGADDLAREHAIYRSVTADYLPGLVAWDAEDPPILVLEDLTGHRWPPPYPADTTPLFDALAAVAATPPPDPATGAVGPDDATWWGRIAEDPRGFLALGLCGSDWLGAVVTELERAERTVDLTGDDLVHGGVFADNLCFAPRGAVLVDWSGWFRGDARFDVACASLALRRDGAAVPPVELDDEVGWAALLAGQLAVAATRPPPPWVRPESGLRDEQVRDLEHALRWCGEVLELPPRASDRREPPGGAR